MTRAPVTIAILAWNSWETTRACLDSLRPTLGPRDQVVVVDNGSTDATPAALRSYPWVEVVTNPTNRGFAGGCNDAAARARHDYIIFLNNDTLLPARWIEPLVDALSGEGVAAAGPRSNFVSGPQLVVSASYANQAAMRRFARDWMQRHRGQSTPTERLVGFCLAVRRPAFEQVGGFDESYGIGGFEDDDLCQRLLKAGWSLVIRHDSFVHHEGHKTFAANGLDWLAEQTANRDRFLSTHFASPPARGASGPLVSGCLIVKDEEDRLGECLSSLRGVADEVVVYDTGSTDGTVELARSLGATVIEGFWDDDFARARNEALSHCRGEWIAWLDADETLQYDDPAAVRSLLALTKPEVDAWSVPIHNLTGAGAGSEFVHHAARFFRRERCSWVGRLHEQVARRDGGLISQATLTEGARIRHTGYMTDMLVGRNKLERNVRVAAAEVEQGVTGEALGYALTSLGRSLVLAGRSAEGLERLTEALDHTANRITRRLALRSMIDALGGLGRHDEALARCRQYRAEGGDPGTAASFEAAIELERGRWAEALELLDAVVADRPDEDGFTVPAGTLAAQKARALAGLDRIGEAADVLLSSLARDGVLDTHLGNLIDFLIRSGRGLAGLPAAIPAGRAALFFAQVLQLNPPTADLVLEACVQAGPAVSQMAVLATASQVAVRLPIERSLVWSARLRAAGQPGSCPLVAFALTGEPAVLRARAAATAGGAFADPAAIDAFWKAYGAAAPAEQEIIRAEAAQLCPSLLVGNATA